MLFNNFREPTGSNQRLRVLLAVGTVLCLTAATLTAQTEQLFHLTRRSPQVVWTNPAMFSPFKTSVGSSSYVSIASNSFSIADFADRIPGEGYTISASNIVDDLNGNQYLAIDEQFGLLLNFAREKYQWGLSYRAVQSNFALVPEETVLLLANGNGQFIGESVNIAPDFAISYYNEFAAHGAYKLGNLSLGARARLIIGGVNSSTERNQIELFTNPEYYQLEFTTDYSINSTGLVTYDPDTGDFGISDSPLEDFINNNNGFAFDLGATYEMGKFFFAASATNIGSIRWDGERSQVYESQGTFVYEGLAFDEFEDEEALGDLVDSLGGILQFQTTNTDYVTALPSRYYGSARYDINDKWSTGFLLYGEQRRGEFIPGATLAVNRHFGDVFTLGTSLGLRNGSYSNVGLNVDVKLWILHGFVVTDNILGLVNPTGTSTANVRFGANLVFGRMDRDNAPGGEL